MDTKKDIKSLNLEELKTELESMGEKAFRAKQMYEWMHVKLVRSFDEMTNLSAKFREQCKEKYEYTCVNPVRIQESKIDGTKKFLFELSDGNVVESVWMQYKHGNSVCISSQVGCRMGCKFCASTLDGLERNLTPSEMLDQIYAITRLTGERVSNVVVMGTGEPMDNYNNILKFLHLLTDENGLNISQRNVTVSTCGIVPRMRQLADEKLQITLALIALAKPLCCHINLIPVNPIKERDYVQSDTKHIQAFKNKLESKMIHVTIRREMGRDIDGACGQLRRRHTQEAKNPGELSQEEV